MDLLKFSPLDVEIIEGAKRGETYQTIADRMYYSHEHVRARGTRILRYYSQIMGKQISKKNFREIWQDGF